jgi:hypothetical protein
MKTVVEATVSSHLAKQKSEEAAQLAASLTATPFPVPAGQKFHAGQGQVYGFPQPQGFYPMPPAHPYFGPQFYEGMQYGGGGGGGAMLPQQAFHGAMMSTMYREPRDRQSSALMPYNGGASLSGVPDGEGGEPASGGAPQFPHQPAGGPFHRGWGY